MIHILLYTTKPLFLEVIINLTYNVTKYMQGMFDL